MSIKHHGDLGELQDKVVASGYEILELRPIQHGTQIRTKEGMVVSWYDSKGTVLIQGKNFGRFKRNCERG